MLFGAEIDAFILRCEKYPFFSRIPSGEFNEYVEKTKAWMKNSDISQNIAPARALLDWAQNEVKSAEIKILVATDVSQSALENLRRNPSVTQSVSPQLEALATWADELFIEAITTLNGKAASLACAMVLTVSEIETRMTGIARGLVQRPEYLTRPVNGRGLHH